jgi:hypothetical protein
MTLKCLLSGSAALLLAGAGAQAADLPIAEPVDYVRICDAFGTGFHYIPGTDTCLRIGGYVRVETHWVDGDTDSYYGVLFDPDSVNNWTTRARGQVSFDARTQSGIGLIRAYVALEMQVGPGHLSGGPLPGVVTPNYDSTLSNLSSAFIQISNDWGVFSAGKLGSFFDFWSSHGYGTRVQIDDSTVDVTAFAWTFAPGNGFSVSIAAEDPASSLDGRRRNSFEDDYEGQEFPDGVANIRLDGSWGSAQVMGAVRHIHDNDGPAALSGDGIGFAVGAGLSIGLPAGWRLDSQGGYSEGAIAYVTDDPGSLGDFDGPEGSDTNTAWAVRAGLIGPLFNPNLSVWLDGSFTHVEEDGSGGPAGGPPVGGPDADEYDQWAVKLGARWEPVLGLGMGPEFAFVSLDMDDVANPGTVEEQPDFDVWSLMWRIQRNF